MHSVQRFIYILLVVLLGALTAMLLLWLPVLPPDSSADGAPHESDEYPRHGIIDDETRTRERAAIDLPWFQQHVTKHDAHFFSLR